MRTPKRCPFCGKAGGECGTAINEPSEACFGCVNQKCPVKPIARALTLDKAISLWNDRAYLPTMTAPGGGKYKGAEFEREIGQALSLWISKGERKDLFRRTVLSGGQWTQAAKGEELRGEPGDIGANHPLAFQFLDKFVVECKHWRYIELIDVIWENHELYEAMKKVRKEAERVHRNWILICRQNFKPTLAFFPVPAGIHRPPRCAWHRLFSGSVYLVKLDEFLATTAPEEFLPLFRGINDE